MYVTFISSRKPVDKIRMLGERERERETAPTVCKLTVGQLLVVAPPVCVYSADRT